jgi:hypothetical protein
MNTMSKARLVKKDAIPPEQKTRGRKAHKARKPPVPAARKAVEITTEWLTHQRKERPSAREAFAALFAKTDPQSA